VVAGHAAHGPSGAWLTQDAAARAADPE
jgi:hypothetical protein